ncbi:hypothetical protein LB577_19450 [Mesorhizobium sp. B283B1A]|uniref:hypothetical protein n=1 Tax=Mesorhizobium TaxID=68287 RepID=UPI0004CF2236|nr:MULTISPECIES: hypothetical protein [Mesorhizobium]MCA0049098.1 hypothetical protein [Mesorhizobium sp. B283B1A]UQS62729.1 hypothetical protein M5D98_21540 [Mesorhizobium opportunistum]
MDAEASGWPAQRTAWELVCDVLRGFQEGNLVSVKVTIATVRERDPHLLESDCHLVEIVVDVAPKRGLFVAFDVREA